MGKASEKMIPAVIQEMTLGILIPYGALSEEHLNGLPYSVAKSGVALLCKHWCNSRQKIPGDRSALFFEESLLTT